MLWSGVILASPWIHRILRSALGAVFVVAGIPKLLNPDAFARKVGDFGLVPDGALLTAAVGLALLEVAAGLALIAGTRAGLHGVTALLLLFLGVLSYGLAAGLDVDCGCLTPFDGSDGGGNLGSALLRDLVMLAVCAYLYAFPPSRTREARCHAKRHA